MTDDSPETVRCWLVERSFDDRNLVTIVYATPDGSRYRQRERSSMSLNRGSPVTAATDIPVDDLEAVVEEATRKRYAAEVERTAAHYEPDDPI